MVNPTVESLPDERSQRLLKTLIEDYIREGRPVGSRNLARSSGLNVSPATVRNVMADLEEHGLVCAPHTSAGRVPTELGYRLFVDSLLRIRPLEEDDFADLRERLQQRSGSGTHQDLIQHTSDLLSGVTRFAGLVTLPRRAHARLHQIEFLPLSERRVLAILVLADGEVENRVIEVERAYRDHELTQLANYLNAHCAGEELETGVRRLVAEMKAVRADIDQLMLDAIEMAEKAIAGDDDGDYVLAGQTNLMGIRDLASMDRMKELFEAFNEKREMLDLLERCEQSEGVRIFIGRESGMEAFGDLSLVTATYGREGDDLGVLGVIGPTRMPYDRVISVVDATAKILGSVFNRRD